MATYLGDVIHQINYDANFNYNIQELPNPTYQNDRDAVRQWMQNRNDHIHSVIRCWKDDTGIEQQEPYQQGIHPLQLSLRDIAKDEFNVSSTVLSNTDRIIAVHDRSRYSHDEFFPMANHIYSSRRSEQPEHAYNISRLKHYQRNAHHLEHYIFYKINTLNTSPEIVTVPMPDNFIWELIADWLADPNLTSSMYTYSPQPFYFFWRSKYKFVYSYHTFWDTGTHYPGYTVYRQYEYYTETPLNPVLPNIIPIHPDTSRRIQQIVDRWQPLDDRDPADYPDYSHARFNGNEQVVPDTTP